MGGGGAGALRLITVPEEQDQEEDGEEGEAAETRLRGIERGSRERRPAPLAHAKSSLGRYPSQARLSSAPYGVRVTLESMISLICSTIETASLSSRCQMLRP